MDETEVAASQDLMAGLKLHLGKRLQAIYRFGSDLGRGKNADHERLLVLVDHIDRPLLDAVSDDVGKAMRAGVRVRIDSRDNLVDGADAFPAFILELRDYRKLLWGQDVLEGIDVNISDLRLHVEQGLRGMHRELVRLYLDRGALADEGPTLRKHVRRLVFLLEGALIAGGHDVPRPLTFDGVVDACCRSMLSDTNHMHWETIKRFARGDLPLRGDDGPKLYSAFFDALDEVIQIVDKM